MTAEITPRVTTLDSGLRIVTATMPAVATASLAVMFHAGSRDERADEHGLAHFLEHMAFKGTARRDARAIAATIEAVGGDLNAATSTEATAFTARVLAADVPLAIDVLADILTASRFDDEEIAREKGVVLQEIAAVEDAPDDLVFDRLVATAFPDQPIGRPILGSPASVQGFGRAGIAEFLCRHYGADRAVVAAAGAVDHAMIVELVERGLAGLPAGYGIRQPASYRGGRDLKVRKLEQAHTTIAFEAPSYQDPAFYAAQLFSGAFGGGMSSRLFQEVREKRGLAYAAYSFCWAHEDTGLLGLYLGTEGARAREALTVALREAQAMAAGPSAEELSRARAQLKVSLLMGLESSSARAEQMARHLLAHGRVIPAEEIVARIDAVTADEVAAAGQRMLSRPPTLAAVGPVRGLAGAESAFASAAAAA